MMLVLAVDDRKIMPPLGLRSDVEAFVNDPSWTAAEEGVQSPI